MRYVHTNIIARDAEKVIEFYKTVFQCRSFGNKRDLKGDWVDRLTGIKDAHIVGEHLLLPGYGVHLPTLEIFSYGEMPGAKEALINEPGIAHLAFEVENVEATLEALVKAGGTRLGEVVTADYPDKTAKLVYGRDIEGNIVELQSWHKK